MFRFLVAALCTATALGAVPDDFVNQRVTRKIDASSHVVASSISYKITGKGSSSTYFVAFTSDEAAHLMYVTAEAEEGDVVYEITRDDSEPRHGFVHYRVKLGTPVTSGDTLSLKVTALFTNVLVPFPAEITQYDSQYVEYRTNAYVASPYATQKQTTNIKLSSSKIEGYSSEPEPVATDGSRLKLGAYSDIGAYTNEAIRVHFENNNPFATLTSVIREIEISMWGNIAVEEHYEMRNSGARLSGGFSRLDFQAKNAKSASFQELTAVLPPRAAEVYYRDVIGNISTSNVRWDAKETVFEFDTRFPLFGGWRIEWFSGYNVPAGDFLSANSDGTYTLTYNPHIPLMEVKDQEASFPIEEYVTKVVLPEGATVIEVTSPIPHTTTQSRRFTYLDGPFLGRPVQILTSRDVISRYPAGGSLRVRFSLPPLHLYLKGIYVTAAFFMLFAVVMIASRIDFSLVPKRILTSKETAEKHKKLR